ncbi:hypothetical protein PRIPAC_93683, partial [Pristionchus pacificus]
GLCCGCCSGRVVARGRDGCSVEIARCVRIDRNGRASLLYPIRLEVCVSSARGASRFGFAARRVGRIVVGASAAAAAVS